MSTDQHLPLLLLLLAVRLSLLSLLFLLEELLEEFVALDLRYIVFHLRLR